MCIGLEDRNTQAVDSVEDVGIFIYSETKKDVGRRDGCSHPVTEELRYNLKHHGGIVQ